MTAQSIFSLLFVASSFVLGGCAAEAESTRSSDDKITHDGTLDGERQLDDVRQIGTISDLKAAAHDEAARIRIIETYKGGVANPRIDVEPPVFGTATQKAHGVVSAEDIKEVVDGHTVSKP